MTGPALFVLGHGTRDERGVQEFHDLVALVAGRLDARGAHDRGRATPVGGGFIELAEPHVDAALDDLVSGGATDVVVVPYVLFGAGHLKDDGPATLARARRRHPQVTFRLARDLGVHPLVLAVAEQRAATAQAEATRPGGIGLDVPGRDVMGPVPSAPAGTGPEAAAVVLVGRGSTDPDAVGEFVKFARLLQDGRGLGEVHPSFVAMAKPDVAGALDRAARLGARRIAVVPLFLFAGVLVQRIADQVAAWAALHPDVETSVAAHLGVDPALADAILERFDEATDGDVRMNCDVCSYRVRLPGYEDKVALPLTLAPHGRGDARGWRARRAAAQAESDARVQRERPRLGFGRALRIPPAGDLDGHPAVEVKGLTFTYPDGRAVLHGVDLTIGAGERVALLGPNGAGKTTLVLALLGVLTPDDGRIRVAGLDVATDVDAVRRLVGLVFQDPDDQLFSPTVRADVAFGPAHLGLRGDDLDERVDAALAAVGLVDQADRAPHHLSVGQRRRAALATVLAMHPKILVLDEPTANLDPTSRRDLVDIVKALDLTLLTVTHDLSFAAELCPRSVVLDSGVVAADGRTTALLANRDTMAAHRLELPFGFRADR